MSLKVHHSPSEYSSLRIQFGQIFQTTPFIGYLLYINKGLVCFGFLAGICGGQYDLKFEHQRRLSIAPNHPWGGFVFSPPTKANRRGGGHQRAKMPSGHPGATAYLRLGNIFNII